MNKEQFISAMRESAQAEDPQSESPAQPEDDTAPAHESEPAAKTQAVPERESNRIPEPESESPPEPKNAKEWLSAGGLDIKDLYDQTIPGTDITFGQAKDAAPDLADIQRLRLDTEQQREESVAQQQRAQQELGAVLQRLVTEFGEEKLNQVIAQAPEDLEQAAQARKLEFLRWRPDLAEPAAYAEAQEQIGRVGHVYGYTAAQMDSADAGIKRMALRLYRLESYLDTLREPEKPPEPVKQGKKPAAERKAPSRPPKRGLSREQDRFTAQFVEALKG